MSWVECDGKAGFRVASEGERFAVLHALPGNTFNHRSGEVVAIRGRRFTVVVAQRKQLVLEATGDRTYPKGHFEKWCRVVTWEGGWCLVVGRVEFALLGPKDPPLFSEREKIKKPWVTHGPYRLFVKWKKV